MRRDAAISARCGNERSLTCGHISPPFEERNELCFAVGMQTFFPLQSHQPPPLPPRRAQAKDEGPHDESFVSAVSSLQRDFARLIDAEKALARAELDSKLRELKADALIAVGGAIFAGLFFMCLVAAAIMALSLVMATWVAALVIGCALGATAVALVVRFQVQLKRFDPVLRQTVENVKRDLSGIRQAVR
jgi:hypothetical protein